MAERELTTDGYVFNFAQDACDAYIFDSPEHNGIRNVMAPVDIIAEFPNEYLFIELKRYSRKDPHGGRKFKCPLWDDTKLINSECPLANDSEKRAQVTLKRIAASLRKKYCDTFLYLHAEAKPDKPVNYVCVVDLDSVLRDRLRHIIQEQFPKGIPTQTNWKRSIVKSVYVVDVNGWNDKLKRYGKCKLDD